MLEGPPPYHIWGMLVSTKDVLTNRLLRKMLPPRSGKQLWSMRD